MIYFCIPAYNEERTVGVVLWKLRQVMAELQRDYQIIVVDDASTDSTQAVLNPYIRVLPLTLIRNSQRRGYADALELAVREAVRRSPYPKRDAVIVMQADFTEDPDVVPLLIKKIEAGADIVATNCAIEPASPRATRWGRRLFQWLVRGHEWAQLGDAASGLRAYRVVLLKRALDTRAGGRLLTWQGLGANVELLAQTVPHSRRTEVVDTTLKEHRLQRTPRFSFMAALREVRGAARGKPAANARALPVDGAIAVPQPLSLEASQRARTHDVETRPRRGARPAARAQAAGAQRERKPPRARGPQRERPPRERAPQRETPVEVITGDAELQTTPLLPSKKRRRPRKRKGKRAQQTPALVVEQAATPVAASQPSETAEPGESGVATPKKKSRRGRRGGRGRRRSPRLNEAGQTNQDSQGASGEDAPPPISAEGD